MEICNGNDHRVLRALARKLVEKGLKRVAPLCTKAASRKAG
jgi:hypothetical protein